MTKKEIIEAQTLCNTWLKDLTPDEINHIEDMMEEYATSLADEMKADITALLREEAIAFYDWSNTPATFDLMLKMVRGTKPVDVNVLYDEYSKTKTI